MSLAEIGRMTSAELTEWHAWEMVNGPLGSLREDLRCAHLAATRANIHRDQKKRRKPFDALDLMPFALPFPEARKQGGKKATNAESQIAAFRAAAELQRSTQCPPQ